MAMRPGSARTGTGLAGPVGIDADATSGRAGTADDRNPGRRSKTALVGGTVVPARMLTVYRKVPEAPTLLEKLVANHATATWPRLVLCEMLIREKLDDGVVVDALLKEILELDPSQMAACQRLVCRRQQTVAAAGLS